MVNVCLQNTYISRRKGLRRHGTPWKQLTLTIRSHGVGVIATLMDNGEQRQLVGEEFDKLAEIPLHPIQFDELSAMCVYQSSLLDRSSAKYMSVGLAKGGTIEVISMPLAGNSTKPLFRDWDLEGYARLLEFYWHQYGATFADIYRGKGRVLTKVSRASGDFPIMDSEGNVTGTRKVWKKLPPSHHSCKEGKLAIKTANLYSAGMRHLPSCRYFLSCFQCLKEPAN